MSSIPLLIYIPFKSESGLRSENGFGIELLQIEDYVLVIGAVIAFILFFRRKHQHNNSVIGINNISIVCDAAFQRFFFLKR